MSTIEFTYDGNYREISPAGTRYFNMIGVMHRDHGPAVELPDGTKEFWKNGKLIRVERNLH